MLAWANLAGVDLSGQMLQQARDRGQYDELVQGNLVDFLAHRGRADEAEAVSVPAK